MSLLGLDIGTTGTKAVLFTESGQIIDSDYQAYTHTYPQPGWVELDPEKVWQAVKKTVNHVAANHGAQVGAICISCMGDNIIPVGKDQTPIYNGLLAFDNRSTEEMRIVEETITRKTYFETMGSSLSTISNLCKLLWLKSHEPAVFSGTWKFMMFADYILMKLGFPAQISYSSASLNIFDIKRKQYPEEMLNEFGMSGSMFSELVPPDHILGEIDEPVASQLGLPKGVKVVAGGMDLACGVLGSGVSPLTPDTVSDVAGTFEHAAYITDEPTLGQKAFEEDIICFCNVVKDSYVIFRGLPTAGAAINWFRDEFAYEEREKAAREGKNVFDVMIEPLEFNGGNIFFHPYFAGHYSDSGATGTIRGMTLDTKKSDILAALVEGITFEYRNNIEIIESIVEKRLDLVRAVGGLSRSKKWLQLKADITGRPVETVSIRDASALGAAIVAGVSTGVYSSFKEAMESIIRVTDNFSPNMERFEIYNEQYQTYRKMMSRWPGAVSG